MFINYFQSTHVDYIYIINIHQDIVRQVPHWQMALSLHGHPDRPLLRVVPCRHTDVGRFLLRHRRKAQQRT